MGVTDQLLDGMAWLGVPLAVALTPWVGHRPAALAPVVPLRGASDHPLHRGDVIRVLSWNIQFCGSRTESFFYDGGRRVHVPPQDVHSSLQAVQSVLADEQPSLTLLQEVDRGATRTGYIDQLREIFEAQSHSALASAPYWRVPFVPTPAKQPLGRVNMHLGTLSSHGISFAQRHQLALLQEPRWRQHFNLKRALLETHIPIEGGGHIAVANTHLSAFSFGDGTLDRQVKALAEWMGSHPPHQPWILAGDLNLLPPGDDPTRLALDRPLYSDASSNPLHALLPRFQTAHDVRGLGPKTYLPHGSPQADRTIDYVFYGGPLECVRADVLTQHNQISDHLPLWAELRLLA